MSLAAKLSQTHKGVVCGWPEGAGEKCAWLDAHAEAWMALSRLQSLDIVLPAHAEAWMALSRLQSFLLQPERQPPPPSATLGVYMVGQSGTSPHVLLLAFATWGCFAA